MQHFPERIQKLIDHFDALPGIGPKHATRLALHLLNNEHLARDLSDDIDAALSSVRFCGQCFTITDHQLCTICSDKKRDQQTICVVAHVQDIEPIERTNKYSGTYHVLHGFLNPIEGITPDQIKTKELLHRIESKKAIEIILALDATAEGEATTLYLNKVFNEKGVRVTRLARGMPVGSSIEYTDEVTLSSALENRN